MAVERHTNIEHTIRAKKQTELAQPLSPLTRKEALMKENGRFWPGDQGKRSSQSTLRGKQNKSPAANSKVSKLAFVFQFLNDKMHSYVVFDISVHFIIQKLKNKHTFLKKYTN